jgi:hypothetical protein
MSTRKLKKRKVRKPHPTLPKKKIVEYAYDLDAAHPNEQFEADNYPGRCGHCGADNRKWRGSEEKAVVRMCLRCGGLNAVWTYRMFVVRPVKNVGPTWGRFKGEQKG